MIILVFPTSCGDEFMFRRPSFPLLTICGCNIGFDVDWSFRPEETIFWLAREFRLGRCNLGLSRLSLTLPKLSSSETGLEDCRGVRCCF